MSSPNGIPPPGPDLFIAVRQGLLKTKWKTVHGYCEGKNLVYSTVRSWLLGGSNSDRARVGRERLKREAGLIP